ncbi:hypothetical protein Bca101_087658 [Brassica carinata]
MMPLNTFHPLLYKQLINLATATNYLPGKDNLYIFTYFCRSKMVRLTLMDNVSALFRARTIQCSIIRQHRIYTSSCLISDSTIDLIQSFIRKNKVSNYS